MSYADFVSKACERLDINSNGYTFHYTLEFDSSALQQLDDDEDMHMMLSHSYDYARIYVLKRIRRVEVEGVDGCPWRITANSVGTTKILKVNIFNDVHNHCADVECSSQPSMRGRKCARVIKQVIRATPQYLSRQICKDFRSRYGVSLSYKQAWTYKEMENERIYGLLENSYMLLPWLCQRLVDINSRTLAECTRQNWHFWPLFIAHSFSIQGFLMGCRPVIAIDSTHLSGPYMGSLFSATAYYVDDDMFSIAFGVKLKGILQDKEVVIILDRHQAILHSVSQLFGVENHAYCYCHVKENFSINMKVYVDVNLRECTCTCKAWQIVGIPCEHACATIHEMKQDVYEYVDSYFNLPMQELIYSGHFNSIPNHNMPTIDADECVRDVQGRLYPSLKPPCSKRPLGRP
uniref:SWIM-type domain-containing protein n=1 Tax=Vitis vinifera TaxID=29760 RepID=A5BZK4_VITVI|nr:hypothetical protein VITISV_000559 [Vitis vinifera]